VQLRYKDVNVRARIAAQRDPLRVARNVGLLARTVHVEQQLGWVVAPVEKRVADRTIAVDAFEFARGVRKFSARSPAARCTSGRRSDVMSWAISWPKPGQPAATSTASRGRRHPVADAAWTRQPQQPLLIFLDGRQIREQPLVPVRCALEWRVGEARQPEATAAGGRGRRVWRLGAHDLRVRSRARLALRLRRATARRPPARRGAP
jgi:hypothetical protein